MKNKKQNTDLDKDWEVRDRLYILSSNRRPLVFSIPSKHGKRPFLHVRYRASEADDRRMKSWITGSVGGNYTSDEDAMNVHFLSERCLCVQAANNFVLLKQTDSTYGD